MNEITIDAKQAHVFVLVTDVSHSNPNGDPDTNAPRQDALGYGYSTGVCLKRHIRDYIELTRGEGIIAVREGIARDTMNAEYNEIGHEKYLDKYWDIRAFGGLIVKATGKKGKKKAEAEGEETNENKVALKGAISVCDAISADPIEILNTTITFCGQQSEGKADGNMGQRPVVNRGIYVQPIFYSPLKSEMSDEDLALFVEALVRHADTSKAANRTGVELKSLYIFTFPGKFFEGRPHLLVRTGDETLVDLKAKVPQAEITVVRNEAAGLMAEAVAGAKA